MTQTERSAPRFGTVYAPELARYVVERGDIRVVPTLSNVERPTDPYGMVRALNVCKVLNRVYANESAK